MPININLGHSFEWNWSIHGPHFLLDGVNAMLISCGLN